jgi:hypothetical protein
VDKPPLEIRVEYPTYERILNDGYCHFGVMSMIPQKPFWGVGDDAIIVTGIKSKDELIRTEETLGRVEKVEQSDSRECTSYLVRVNG